MMMKKKNQIKKSKNARPRRVFMVGINQTSFFDRPICPSISSYQAFHGVLETIHGSNVRNCELYIVNVIPTLQFPQGQCMDGGPSSYERSAARQNNDANVLVQKLVDICNQHRITAHPLVIQSDNVGAALVQASEKMRADVLVIGNQGRDVVDPIESVSLYCRGNARNTDLRVVPRRLDDMSRLRIHINGVLASAGWVIPTSQQQLTVYRERILDPTFD